MSMDREYIRTFIIHFDGSTLSFDTSKDDANKLWEWRVMDDNHNVRYAIQFNLVFYDIFVEYHWRKGIIQ